MAFLFLQNTSCLVKSTAKRRHEGESSLVSGVCRSCYLGCLLCCRRGPSLYRLLSAVTPCCSGSLSLSLFFSFAQFNARVWQFRWPSKGLATEPDSDRARELASRKECRLVSLHSCMVQNSFEMELPFHVKL